MRVYDPEGMEGARSVLDCVDYAEDPYDCANGAEALAIVTEWDAFRALDLPRIKALMKAPVVVDLRNIYVPTDMERHGFRYVSIGRPESRPG